MTIIQKFMRSALTPIIFCGEKGNYPEFFGMIVNRHSCITMFALSLSVVNNIQVLYSMIMEELTRMKDYQVID